MKKKLMLLLALATIGCSAFGFASCDLLEKLPFFGDKVVDEQPGDDEYVVTYADGDTILEQVTVADGSNPDRPADPTKTGYKFKCWSYDPDTAERLPRAFWSLVHSIHLKLPELQ